MPVAWSFALSACGGCPRSVRGPLRRAIRRRDMRPRCAGRSSPLRSAARRDLARDQPQRGGRQPPDVGPQQHVHAASARAGRGERRLVEDSDRWTVAFGLRPELRLDELPGRCGAAGQRNGRGPCAVRYRGEGHLVAEVGEGSDLLDDGCQLGPPCFTGSALLTSRGARRSAGAAPRTAMPSARATVVGARRTTVPPGQAQEPALVEGRASDRGPFSRSAFTRRATPGVARVLQSISSETGTLPMPAPVAPVGRVFSSPPL